MCGIVGAVSQRSIEKILVDGLKRLEYRGYDSAGIAALNDTETLQRLRVVGKVKELESALSTSTLRGKTGVAHTRWATHGAPSEQNTHPLTSHDKFALVHNGIIENHVALRAELQANGYQFTSETDTEVVVHLLHQHFKQTNNLLSAVFKTVKQLEGAYSLGIISLHDPDRLIAVRHGSPLVIGLGQGENFLASDPLALLSVTQQFIYLNDHDVADLSYNSVQIYDRAEKKVQRETRTLTLNYDAIERGEHRHFMMKEIMEQPRALAACLDGRMGQKEIFDTIFGYAGKEIFPKIKHVQLVACGTSYHAAMVARYWLEAVAGIPCTVEIASEYRYRQIVVQPDSLFVVLSQSGETADAIAALRLAKKSGYLKTLAICNMPESSLVREADLAFLMRAGMEIGVASTKAFVTQLVSLLLLTLVLSKRRHDKSQETAIVAQLQQLSSTVENVLQLNAPIARLAKSFVDKQHALFLGRGPLYPIALEGALKLKEISYIHAEGYPAGELKHGPLALVDRYMPVIALAPYDVLFEKLSSNLHEVRARGGELFVFTDRPDCFQEEPGHLHTITMPAVDSILAPIVYTIPLQLLAYHVAVLKGTDVDQPRNLAKSVTVE